MDTRVKRFYEFDSFRIDIEERQLLSGGAPVLLTPKVFDILLALVENNGHTIGKDELMDRVWAGTYVEAGNLNRNISTLRKVLGEDSHTPRLIKTVPTRGYRFDGGVREIVEEEETLTVEKRTNYSLSMKTEESKSVSSRFSLSPLAAIFAGSAVLVVVLGFVWGFGTTGQNRAAVLAAEISRQRGTTNDEAFDLYQKGRKLWQNRTVDGLHNATLLLEQAVERDPGFARAHAALADAYAFDVGLWKKAETVANEAIRLDPTLAGPHATIGFIRTFWEWKLPEAETHFKQAIALDPNYATAHQWYSLNLAARTLRGGALAEMERALELEPGSAAINTDMCRLLYFARKYDMAIAQCRKALEIDPNFLNAHINLYEIYTTKGMSDEALDEYFSANALNKTSAAAPSQVDNLRTTYAKEGMRGFWATRLELLGAPVGPYTAAQYHARLGQHSEALAALQRAYETRDFEFLFLAADPVFEKLCTDRESERFLEIFVK